MVVDALGLAYYVILCLAGFVCVVCCGFVFWQWFGRSVWMVDWLV